MARLLLAILLWPTLALAESVTLTWNPPTETTDGSAIQPGELTEYQFDCIDSEFAALTWQAEGTPPHVIDMAPGEYLCELRVANSVGYSDWSEPAPISVPATPNPPTDLTIGPDLTVYTLVQSRDRIALVAVGTAAPGTPCDPTQNVHGKYVLPVTAVTFAGSVRPEVVVGACQ